MYLFVQFYSNRKNLLLAEYTCVTVCSPWAVGVSGRNSGLSYTDVYLTVKKIAVKQF